MSGWSVRKRADILQPGDRFIFSEEIGGEGETLTVERAAEAYGIVEVRTEELDFTLTLAPFTLVTMAVD